MLFNKIKIQLFFFILLFAAISGCKEKNTEAIPSTPKSETGSITFNLNALIDGEDLELESKVFLNPLDESFLVKKFAFYISDIKLLKDDQIVYTIPDSYILYDKSKPNFNNVKFSNIPLGSYTGLEFTFGIDSVRNYSGAGEGALDPINGMYWTWNTGFINLKFEGEWISPDTNTTFIYHLGGFRQPYYSYRIVEPANNLSFSIGNNNNTTIYIDAEINKFFGDVQPMSFSQNQVIMDPSSLSAKLSNNCARMFKINRIE